jgi:transposase
VYGVFFLDFLEVPGMLKKRLDEVSRQRVRAGRLVQKGKKPAEVAHATGVARQTVYVWKKVFDEGGIDALQGIAAPGRPARLEARQLEGLARALLKKPSAYGFETELCTLKRVGVLIQRLYGMKFGLTNIWLILGALGFSPQKPERRAIERDEKTVLTWKRCSWPALKKRPGARRARSFSSTSRA